MSSAEGSITASRNDGGAMRLETDRLVLDEVTVADAMDFLDYMPIERYWRTLPIERPTLPSIRAFLEKCIAERAKDPRPSYFLAARDKATGGLVGEGILHVRSFAWLEAEVGWGVACPGRGLATEIARAMLDLAFGALGLHRVYARSRVDNGASRRIMEKLGMREEGVLREHAFARGEWWSSLQCAILANEWAGAAPTRGPVESS